MNTLESFEEFQQSLQNFQWLSKAVPGASDLDFCCHCSVKGSNYFLFLEFKPPGGYLSRGQRILLEALREEENKSVIIVYGPDKDGMYVLSWDWQGKVDKDGLSSLVKTWWESHKGKKAA